MSAIDDFFAQQGRRESDTSDQYGYGGGGQYNDYPQSNAAHQEDLRGMAEMMQQRNSGDFEEKPKKSKFPKPSFNVRGSFKKVKNKLSKKDKQQITTPANVIEEPETEAEPGLDPAMLDYNMDGRSPDGSGYSTPQAFDHHPGGYDINPSDTLPRKGGSSFGTMKASVKDWLHPAIANDPPNRPTDIAVLKNEPRKSLIRMSNIIYCILLMGAFVGFILLCLSSRGQHYVVIGALFLGLSLFALIGKVFASIFWSEDPCPRLRPAIDAMEYAIGGAKDPYRLKEPYLKQNTMPQVQAYNFPMEQYTYTYSDPYAAQPEPYDYAAQAQQYGYDTQADAYAAQTAEYNYGFRPEYTTGYEATDADYYAEKGSQPGESMDTQMRAGRSMEAIIDSYDGKDYEGYTGPFPSNV